MTREIDFIRKEIAERINRFDGIAGDSKLSQNHREIARKLKSIVIVIDENLTERNKNKKTTFSHIDPGILLFCAALLPGWFFIGFLLCAIVVEIYFRYDSGGNIVYLADGTERSEAIFWPVWQGGFVVVIIIIIGLIYYSIKNKMAQEDNEYQDTVCRNAHSRLASVDAEYDTWIAEQNRLAETLTEMTKLAPKQLKVTIETINEAKSKLDAAQEEFSKGAFVAFWDLVEQAGERLSKFTLHSEKLQEIIVTYNYALSNYKGSNEIPLLIISNTNVESLDLVAREQSKRFNDVSYDAQLNDKFAQIYELRRNTHTLIQGFRSLRDAIDNVGSRITQAIYDLEATVSDGIRDTAQHLGEIQSAVWDLVETEERRGLANATELATLRQTADRGFQEMSRHARYSRASMVEALKNDHEMKVMLRGIQTGRPVRFQSRFTDLYGTILDPGPNLPRFN